MIVDFVFVAVFGNRELCFGKKSESFIKENTAAKMSSEIFKPQIQSRIQIDILRKSDDISKISIKSCFYIKTVSKIRFVKPVYLFYP